MALPIGFEPMTHALEGRCSIHWAKEALIKLHPNKLWEINRYKTQKGTI